MPTKSSEKPNKLFEKICITGAGKGRLEFLQNKYPFTYESEINRKRNEFVLAFDFPIVGEKKMSLSLDPRVAAKQINHSQIVRLIESQIGERTDREQITQGVEEFFVLTSEFVQFKAINKIPSVYEVRNLNDHFILERTHGDHLFEIDSYVLNQDFFERVVVKVFPKLNKESGPILTLYLVAESCEK